jgi:hypothetical protein
MKKEKKLHKMKIQIRANKDTLEMRTRTLETIRFLTPYFLQRTFDFSGESLFVHNPELNSPVLKYPHVSTRRYYSQKKPSFCFLDNQINYPDPLPSGHPTIAHEVGHWFHFNINPCLWERGWELTNQSPSRFGKILRVINFLKETLANYAEATFLQKREIIIDPNLTLYLMARLNPYDPYQSEDYQTERVERIDAKLKIWNGRINEFLDEND